MKNLIKLFAMLRYGCSMERVVKRYFVDAIVLFIYERPSLSAVIDLSIKDKSLDCVKVGYFTVWGKYIQLLDEKKLLSQKKIAV